MAYFSSYALWNYLTIPFLYTYPGFVTEELPTWQEDGEYWRALKIRFPDYITTHTGEQISYSVLTDYCGDAIFQFVRDLYPGFEFENLQILIDTPDQVFAEYEFTAISSKTGRRIHQLFFGRLVSESGKIKCLREALNTAAAVRGIFPEGLSGIPAGAPLSHSL